ncbi:MAG: hypothetical protein AB7O96_16985 [Pseudobdellovibrionaceae bacterium]
MKYLLSVLMIGFSGLAFAGYSEEQAVCFRADTPEAIDARILNLEGEIVAQEKAKEAHLKIFLAKYDEYPAMNRARLSVTTISDKQILVSALKHETRNGHYYVECDGGSMNIDLLGTQKPARAFIKSDGIRGDVVGCDGVASIRTPGANFSKVDCE